MLHRTHAQALESATAAVRADGEQLLAAVQAEMIEQHTVNVSTVTNKLLEAEEKLTQTEANCEALAAQTAALQRSHAFAADEQAQLRHQLETSRVELESKTKAVEQSRSEQSLARLAAEQDLQRLAEEHAAKLRQAEAGKRLLGACSSVCQTDPKHDLRSFATVLPCYQFEPTVAVPANTY